jgi:hypothetical protein
MAISSTSVITTAATAIYTSTNSTACTVIYICNTSASTVTVTVNVGAAATNTNTIYKLLSIVANDTYVINMERLMLDNGQSIWVTASAANAIVTTVSYLEI